MLRRFIVLSAVVMLVPTCLVLAQQDSAPGAGAPNKGRVRRKVAMLQARVKALEGALARVRQRLTAYSRVCKAAHGAAGERELRAALAVIADSERTSQDSDAALGKRAINVALALVRKDQKALEQAATSSEVVTALLEAYGSTLPAGAEKLLRQDAYSEKLRFTRIGPGDRDKESAAATSIVTLPGLAHGGVHDLRLHFEKRGGCWRLVKSSHYGW